MKRVQVTIEVDSNFVGLLQNVLTMKDAFKKNNPDTLTILGIVVLGEAMGQHAELTREKITEEWKPHIDIVPQNRKVKEVEL